jgi:hypothetical protein
MRRETVAQQQEQVVGYIARREGGSLGLERWALYRADGSLSNTFAADEDRDAVKALLASAGLILRDDDSVVRA